jgi:hypothetical protein
LAGGLPPRGRDGRFGSKGRIFSHWASVSNRPYRAIAPPVALLLNGISHFRQTNHHQFSAAYPVLKQLLEKKKGSAGQLDFDCMRPHQENSN